MRGQLLNLNPLVAIYDGVFDASIVTAAIKAGENNLRAAAYSTDDEVVVGEKRTNLQATVDQWAFPGQNVPHPDSTHAGFPASSGVRLVLSVWWWERKFHIPRSFPAVEGENAQF